MPALLFPNLDSGGVYPQFQMNAAGDVSTEAIVSLLNNFYGLYGNELPSSKPKHQWSNENKRGFFLGLIQTGEERHIRQLYELLTSHMFEEQQVFSSIKERMDMTHPATFIDVMFGYYIEPFHKGYSSGSSCDSSPVLSPSSSRVNSAEDISKFEPTHRHFQKSVQKRDGVCLFCWEKEPLECSHIVAQKPKIVAIDELSTLERAGLYHKHQVRGN